MADLRELTTDARRLYEAMDHLLAKQEAAGNEDEDFKEIWFSARSRPFEGHVLSKREDTVCRKYLMILASLAALADSGDKRTVQIRFIARILAACGNAGTDIKEVMTDGMLLSERSLDEFYEMGDEELQMCLLVDLLIMCYLDGEPEERQIDFAVGFMAVLGLREDVVKAVGNAVKGVLEQDDRMVLKQCEWNGLENLCCYMKNPLDGVLVNDIDQAMEVDAKKIIFVEKTWQALPILDCDKFKANIIEFVECTFNGAGGIKGKNNKVIFKNCIFSNSEVEENYMTLRYATMSKCSFINIGTLKSYNKHLLQFVKSNIDECVFENELIRHKSVGWDVGMFGGLLKAKETTISSCLFIGVRTSGCSAYGSRSRRVLDIYEGKIFSCTFKNCNLEKDSYLLTVSENAAYSDIVVEDLNSTAQWINTNRYGNDDDLDFEKILKDI